MAAMAGLMPFVIGARLLDMAANPHSAKSQAEFARMVSEKTRAGFEAASAVAFQTMRDGIRIADAMARGNTAALVAAGDRVAMSAVRPYARRVRANNKRLSK
jgi:hypothetical protein